MVIRDLSSDVCSAEHLRHGRGIRCRATACVVVCSLGRKVCERFAEHTPDRSQGPVACRRREPCEAVQAARAGFEVGGEQFLWYAPPRTFGGLFEIAAATAELAPQRGQRRATFTVVQHCRNLVHERVAGRAVETPVAIQMFVRCKNLFGDHLGGRSEENTSALQSLMRISYAVFFLS